MTAQDGWQAGVLANTGFLLLAGAGQRFVPSRWQTILLIVELECVLAAAALGFVVGGRAFFVFAGLAVFWTVYCCRLYQDRHNEDADKAAAQSLRQLRYRRRR